MDHSGHWQSYLPFFVIAVVLAIRLRRMNHERRMHPWRLLIGPVIIALFAAGLLITATPDTTGLAIGAGGVAIGTVIGWQRARLMKMAYDRQSETFSIRQSPAALIFVIAIMVLRRVIIPAQPIGGAIGHAVTARALWPIDGLIGFGLAMVVAHNAELWLRARKLRATDHAAAI